MKKKRSLFTILVAVFLITITSAFPVLAATQEVAPVVTQADKSTTMITDPGQAIQLIEQNFLGSNKNGTSYIKDGASKKVDATLLKSIEAGMNGINKEIEAGVLYKDPTTHKIDKVKKDIQTMYSATGTYEYYWYGFSIFMDAYNAHIMGDELSANAYIMAGGAAVAGFFTVGGAAFVGAVSAATIGYWGTQATLGGDRGTGCVVDCFGTPTWAEIYNVYAR